MIRQPLSSATKHPRPMQPQDPTTCIRVVRNSPYRRSPSAHRTGVLLLAGFVLPSSVLVIDADGA